MQLSSLQLRALARVVCAQVVPPETLSDVLKASILENGKRLLDAGAAAVITSSSSGGLSSTQTILPGTLMPGDVISAMELLLEVVEALEAAGVPPEDMCSELQKQLVPASKQILKNYTGMFP